MFRIWLKTLLMVMLCGSFGGSAETFVIARHQNSAVLDPCYHIVTQAYEMLQIAVRVDEFPGRRSLQVAKNGIADAEMCRIALVENEFPELLRVDPPLMQIELVAVTRHNMARISDVAQLMGMNVGSIRGMMAAEMVLQDLDVQYLSQGKQLLRALQGGLLDVLILTRKDAERYTAQGLMDGNKIHPGSLYQLKLYHYIHRRHSHLKLRLGLAIRQQMMRYHH